MPRASTPEFIFDAVAELLRANSTKFTREIVVSLYDSSAGEYRPLMSGEHFYVDINEYVDGNILTIPPEIYELYKVMTPFGDTGRLGQWVVLFGTSISCNIKLVVANK